MSDADLGQQKRMIDALALTLEKQGNRVQLFETHISWVLVAGNFAYKFKKAVRFDFVDYSTLDARRLYCHEEIRLNRRLAAHIYLSVIAIGGSLECPALDGEGPAIEYAVKMWAFEQQALWSRRLENRLLSTDEIDALATVLAAFHDGAATAPKNTRWCTPDVLGAVAKSNLDDIARMVEQPEEKQWVAQLRQWDTAQRKTLNDTFAERKAAHRIRECHGDLHIDNVLTVGGQVQVFDCIEFNDDLRWIDVMNDIAFTTMELAFRQRGDLAARLLNRYLEKTGDYRGLAVHRYYEVQRALVRCKVALLRAGQMRAVDRASNYEQTAKSYLGFAVHAIRRPSPALIITHGFSGSGKTTFAGAFAEVADAIQIRSDIERKRIHGYSAANRSAAYPGAELYDLAATQATYEHLRELARKVVDCGRTVIVDAAFLRAWQRALFKSLAFELNVPFVIFDILTDEQNMRSRITARASSGRDASDAGLEVLSYQLANHDPLSADETRNAIVVDMTSRPDRESILRMCAPVLDLLPGVST